MQLIEPSYEIITYPPHAMKLIEMAGRVCYKSEGKITEESHEKFIENIIERGHESVLEHASITVKFVHNRGFTHELVRHRVASFSQESTRYVKYDDIEIIKPYWMDESCSDLLKIRLLEHYLKTEILYKDLLETGYPPQAARGILPNDLKTEIYITANFREWRHIFNLRCSMAAHPDMRRVMVPLRDELHVIFPVIF